MRFYDQGGNRISPTHWLNLYEPLYFLNTPNLCRNLTGAHKSHPDVEKIVERLLIRGVKRGDIPFIFAWKLGAIDHKNCSSRRIVYRQNFMSGAPFNTQFLSVKGSFLVNHCQNQLPIYQKMSGKSIFFDLYNNRGTGNDVGLVYCISLLYFISKGYWPIYDRFAHYSLLAIANHIKPHNRVPHKQVGSWRGYLNYVHLISKMCGKQNISRKIDRALWVYGHQFKV